MWKNNEVMTIVVPGLGKKEAVQMKGEFIDLKNNVAPKANASIMIGRKENFSRIAGKCSKLLGGK